VRWTVETPLIAVHDSGKPLVAEVILLFLMVFYFTVWLLGFCGFLASWFLWFLDSMCMSRMNIAILGDQIARARRICTVSPPHQHLISPGSLKSLLATTSRWSWCWRVQRFCQPSKGTVLLKFFCLQYQQEPTHIFVYTKMHKVYTVYSWPTLCVQYFVIEKWNPNKTVDSGTHYPSLN